MIIDLINKYKKYLGSIVFEGRKISIEIEFSDEFGPEKILHVYDPKVGMHGILVIDNTTLGPGKGGIRTPPTITTEEIFYLARTIRWKCAIAELPSGGGKSGIIANLKQMPKEKKMELIHAFSRSLKPVCPKLYVAAPDINTRYMPQEHTYELKM